MLREVLTMGLLAGMGLGAISGGGVQGVEEIGGIRWPADRVLPIFAEPARLDVVDTEGLRGDERLMLATLQGVVNRQVPRVYLIEGEPAEGRFTWLRSLGVPYDVYLDGWSLIDKYRSELNGLIVYDPAVPDTINVATTLAGIESGLVVSPALLQRLTSVPYRFRVIADLRGKFHNGLEAYQWQFEQHWSHVTHRMLIGLNPGLSAAGGEPFGYLRDYAVANRALVFWLSSGVPEERRLFERILSSVSVGTPYLGWFGQDVAGEFGSTELTSRHGVTVLASDWCSNLTVFSGVRARRSVDSPIRSADVPLENKFYVTFVMSEGDNLQYNQHRMRRLWDDPARGRVPINWTISPLLLDVAPVIYQHYRSTATASDLLVAGPSGAGYYYPTPWPDQALESYASVTRRYLNRAGLSSIYVLNRVGQRDVPLTAREVKAYAGIARLDGLFVGWGTWTETAMDDQGLPVATVRGVGDQGELRDAIASMMAAWDRKMPCFVAIGVLSWKIGPTELAAIVDAHRGVVVAVTGDRYFDLYRRARTEALRHQP